MAYIDDTVICSGTWEQYVHHIENILEELRHNGLMANPKKCALGQTEIKYLGFKLRQGRIAPIANEVEAIQSYQQPQIKKQLRAFLRVSKLLLEVYTLVLRVSYLLNQHTTEEGRGPSRMDPRNPGGIYKGKDSAV